MSITAAIGPVANVVVEALKFLNERQRTKYNRKYYDILERLDKAQNEVFPEYSDAKINIIKQELDNFYVALGPLLKEAREKRDA